LGARRLKLRRMTQLQRTADVSFYRDPARFAAERKSVFARSWLFMGHQSELSLEGDVLTATLAGYPLIVVRGPSGIKAFHNVCRHRAGPLFDEERGNCGGALTCKYHGWVYAMDGRLKNARDFGAATGFDPRDYGLFEVRVESWRGFAFVNVDGQAPALAAQLAPLDARLGARDLSALQHTERRTHDIACNWKIYVENYLEGYHIPLVHPQLAAEVDATKYQVTVDGALCFHYAPPKVSEGTYNGLWAFALPHLGINVYEHGLMMERMVPVGLSGTRLIYDFYLTPAAAADPFKRRQVISTSAIVTGEDKWICERVQANIEAGVYQSGVLSPKHETGVAWFQDFLAGAV
jgi:choline monooxygenase